MSSPNFTENRARDARRVLDSTSPRKVVVAGPGTGKSFLFQEAIKAKKKEGGNNFLAITFVGKLCDELASDLAGLARTRTLHGFARKLFLKHMANWKYYPRMKDIIEHDLKLQAITNPKIDDNHYANRSNYYQAVGDDDVIYYALQLYKKYPEKIPIYDLILIDEFQDFNEIEAEFIDQLSAKNEILLVGDDDQALYEFKGSSPEFIREKHNEENSHFEKHTLKYCSRCTQVIVNAFHGVVSFYKSKGLLKNRINKDYICYSPDKETDNSLNPKILLVKNIPPGFMPKKIREELENISEKQKVQSVLVIGEGRTCKKLLETTASQLKEFGFKNVKQLGLDESIFSFNEQYLAGYKALKDDESNVFAWRLLIEKMDIVTRDQIIIKSYDNQDNFISNIPEGFRKKHLRIAGALNGMLTKTKSARERIADSTIERLKIELIKEQKKDKRVFLDQLISRNKHLPRPLSNIEITVCNILGSKGLGADVVFLIGFDQGRLPIEKRANESEIYQFLVALTRTKKRMYLFNTIGYPISSFMNSIEDCV